MRIKIFLLQLFVITSLLFPETVTAQSCSGCTITITGQDSASYIVGAGQTVCVDSLAEFSGTIAINGGTLCNRGFFHPASWTFSTGSISNHSVLLFDQTVTLDSSFVIQNHTKGNIGFLDGFTISSGNFTNNGLVSIRNDLTFTAGTLVNTAILSCRYLLGAGVSGIINSGIINKEGL